MGWVEDCTWLNENLPPLVTEDLPALLDAVEAHRTELAALAQIVPQIETAAEASLRQLGGALDAWRQEVEPKDDALREAASTIAVAVEQVLAGLTEVRRSLSEDAAESVRQFDRLAAVVSHAGAELGKRRASAVATLTQASADFKGVSDRLTRTGASATTAASEVVAQIAPVYQASERAVGTVTSRMKAIAEEAPHHFETTTTSAAAPSVALQASIGVALDRLATETEELAEELAEKPLETGEALEQACDQLRLDASALQPFLVQAVMALERAREAMALTAQGVGDERATLRQLADAVRTAARLVSADWGATVRP